jgi:hypothetical protein
MEEVRLLVMAVHWRFIKINEDKVQVHLLLNHQPLENLSRILEVIRHTYV